MLTQDIAAKVVEHMGLVPGALDPYMNLDPFSLPSHNGSIREEWVRYRLVTEASVKLAELLEISDDVIKGTKKSANIAAGLIAWPTLDRIMDLLFPPETSRMDLVTLFGYGAIGMGIMMADRIIVRREDLRMDFDMCVDVLIYTLPEEAFAGGAKPQVRGAFAAGTGRGRRPAPA